MKKKSALAILLFSLVLIGNLNAQVKKNIIKTSLFFPLLNTVELSYECVFKPDKSFQISGFAGGEVDAGFLPEFRYYLSENQVAPNGVYVAPFAMVSTKTSGGGIMVGVQKLFKEKISLEASLGPFITGNGVAVMGGINIGIAF